jgi:hypothetical protein
MFILQIGAWFIFSCILMSFIEHQIHRKLMHRKNYLSVRTASFNRTDWDELDKKSPGLVRLAF